MSKDHLRTSVREILADKNLTLSEAGEKLLAALSKNPDAIEDLTASYRIAATDTGAELAFRVTAGVTAPLSQDEEAEVTVTGTEQYLTRLLRGELAPLPALLTGKIRLKGDKAKLLRFGEFL